MKDYLQSGGLSRLVLRIEMPKRNLKYFKNKLLNSINFKDWWLFSMMNEYRRWILNVEYWWINLNWWTLNDDCWWYCVMFDWWFVEIELWLSSTELRSSMWNSRWWWIWTLMMGRKSRKERKLEKNGGKWLEELSELVWFFLVRLIDHKIVRNDMFI